MQPIIESTTQQTASQLPLQGLRLWRATLLNQTELSPSKTVKFIEKYIEQLKEGQLWRKEGIPRYVQSLTLKTKIANTEAKLAKWSVMVINDKSLLMLF